MGSSSSRRGRGFRATRSLGGRSSSSVRLRRGTKHQLQRCEFRFSRARTQRPRQTRVKCSTLLHVATLTPCPRLQIQGLEATIESLNQRLEGEVRGHGGMDELLHQERKVRRQYQRPHLDTISIVMKMCSCVRLPGFVMTALTNFSHFCVFRRTRHVLRQDNLPKKRPMPPRMS